jgi:hypothetical protein
MVPGINKTCAAATPYVFSKKVHAPAATLLSRDLPSITTRDEVWGVAGIGFEVALGVELGCAGRAGSTFATIYSRIFSHGDSRRAERVPLFECWR